MDRLLRAANYSSEDAGALIRSSDIGERQAKILGRLEKLVPAIGRRKPRRRQAGRCGPCLGVISARSTRAITGVVKIASPNHRSPLYPRRSAVEPIQTANPTQIKLGMTNRIGRRLGMTGSIWRSTPEPILVSSIGQPNGLSGDIPVRQVRTVSGYPMRSPDTPAAGSRSEPVVVSGPGSIMLHPEPCS